MARLIIPLTILIFIAAIAPALQATDAKGRVSRSYPASGHGELQLNVPGEWKESIRAPTQPGQLPTFAFADDPAQKFSMLLTIIPGPADPNYNSPPRLREMANSLATRMLPTAEEKAVILEEFKGSDAAGFYFTLTDKKPKPGSFQYATFFTVAVGDLVLNVMFLHHEKDLAERQMAIDLLKSARQVKLPPKAAELRVAMPGADWTLVLPIKGLEVVEDRGDPDKKIRQLLASNRDTGVGVSVFMEPAHTAGGSAAARDAYWGLAKNSPLPKFDVKLDTVGDFAVVQYMIPPLSAVPANQRNVNVYIAHAGVWIDVHLSKMQSPPRDQAMFDEIVKGIKFEKAAGR